MSESPSKTAESVEPVEPAPAQRFGIVGAVLIGVGAVLGILAFTVLPWYRGSGRVATHPTFGQVHHQVDYLRSQFDTLGAGGFVHFGVSPLYFAWLAWLLLAAAIVAALVAVRPLGRYTGPMRGTAAIVSLAGFGLTLWAIDLYTYGSPYAAIARANGEKVPSFGFFLGHSSFGAWAALAAFLLAAVGAVLGPRRA